MIEATIEDMWRVAVMYHQTGKLAEAEEGYRKVLARRPEHAEAWHQLGILASQTGRAQEAVDAIGRAILLKPGEAMYYKNLGVVLQAHGQMEDAIGCFRKAVEFNPGFAEAHYNLGNAVATRGQGEEAVASFAAAIKLNPDYSEAHNNMGVVLRMTGRLVEAIAQFREAVRSGPGNFVAMNSLGSTLQVTGSVEEAIGYFRRAIELMPEYAEALSNLGMALNEVEDYEGAIGNFERAIKLKPTDAENHVHLGWAYYRVERHEEAVGSYREAMRLKAGAAAARGVGIGEVHRLMGLAMRDQGETGEAIKNFREAIRIVPQNARADSNLLHALYYLERMEGKGLLEEHRAWDKRHAEPLKKFWQAHGNDREAERRLRVGYVSGDVREEKVGRFMVPLLKGHDREKFEVFCYGMGPRGDGMMEKWKGLADQWRGIKGKSDEQVAAMAREDKIDILVDLGMHGDEGRLLVFARKPAPVQVTYLAYVGTTGVSAMDYRLTDPHLEGKGAEAGCYTEEGVRAGESYWCYEPVEGSPGVNELPAQHGWKAGKVTFGCLNNFAKVSEKALKVWGKVMKELPESRLLLRAQAGSHRERVVRALGEMGVGSGRIEFVERRPVVEYLEAYQRVDIGLDPFPYAGAVTTCDALWMGVPVVTLAGKLGVGRGGVSILTNVGMWGLVAGTEEEYVEIAVRLAKDQGRLKEMRAGLRERMRRSVLMDAGKFVGNMEGAYRGMWKRWCARGAV